MDVQKKSSFFKWLLALIKRKAIVYKYTTKWRQKKHFNKGTNDSAEDRQRSKSLLDSAFYYACSANIKFWVIFCTKYHLTIDNTQKVYWTVHFIMRTVLNTFTHRAVFN